jgi:hypothetical protein
MRFWKYRDREEVVDADGRVHHVGPTEGDVQDAYDRGRRDERVRHKGHPFIALIVFVIALVGGIMLFLAIREGSFSGAGQVADQQIAVAQAEAPSVLANAKDSVSAAAGDVSAKVKDDKTDNNAAPADTNR